MVLGCGRCELLRYSYFDCWGAAGLDGDVLTKVRACEDTTTHHDVEPKKLRKKGRLHADVARHSVDEAVNDVTPSNGDSKPAGHVVHAPQLIGQAGLPGLERASEHDLANSLTPQLEVQVRVVDSAKMSGDSMSPRLVVILLPVMMTLESMVATVYVRYMAPPLIYHQPQCFQRSSRCRW